MYIALMAVPSNMRSSRLNTYRVNVPAGWYLSPGDGSLVAKSLAMKYTLAAKI